MNVFFVLMKLFLVSALADTGLEGLQSGRYEIHRSPGQVKTSTASTIQAEITLVPEVTVSPVIKKAKKARRPSSEEAKSAKEEAQPSSPAVPSGDTTKPNPAEKTEVVVEPSLSDQAQSLAQGNLDQVYDFYRERVHPDDIRNNRGEIEFAPSFVYNDSKSNYSYRNFTSSFSAVSLKANVWFTPLIGIGGRYIFSLAADVNSSLPNQSRSPARYEFLDLSMNFRKFFGLSRKANSLEFDILYTDSKMRVPADDTSHMQLSSSGFGLGLKARFPSSASYAWTLGGNFFPRLQSKEAAAGIAVSSGAASDSTRIGLDLGGEFKFTRESQFVWNLGVSSEKNLFDGPASAVDPVTGLTPNNVSVTNTILLLNLGYRWGQ